MKIYFITKTNQILFLSSSSTFIFVIFFAFFNRFTFNSNIPWIGNTISGLMWSLSLSLLSLLFPMKRFVIKEDGLVFYPLTMKKKFIQWDDIADIKFSKIFFFNSIEVNLKSNNKLKMGLFTSDVIDFKLTLKDHLPDIDDKSLSKL